MTDHDRHERGSETLLRMIAYLRDEAIRLGIVDAALLLEHAEEAAAVFSPVSLRDGRGGPFERLRSSAEH